MTDIVILAAHPDLAVSRATRRAMQAAGALPGVVLRDLYALYPDYLIDVAAEQQALQKARLIVWLHPIQWYTMPALMKLWVDEVLTFGWAYGPGGGALRGKDLWLVTSTGGPAESYRPGSYNHHTFEDFLPPYSQTAALVHMRFLPPLVLHGAQRASDERIAEHAATLAERLQRYPDWPGLSALPVPGYGAADEVPAGARPG